MANQINALSPFRPLSVSHDKGGPGPKSKWILDDY